MLPFLHQQLHLSALAPASDADTEPSLPRPSAHDPLREHRTRLGYASPHFTSPDFTGPAAPNGTDASSTIPAVAHDIPPRTKG